MKNTGLGGEAERVRSRFENNCKAWATLTRDHVILSLPAVCTNTLHTNLEPLTPVDTIRFQPNRPQKRSRNDQMISGSSD